MGINEINIIFVIYLISWVLLAKKSQNAFAPLFMSGMSSIPIYYFGRSSSGGIFPVDIVAVAFIIRFGLTNTKLMLSKVVERKLIFPICMLALWATFSGIYAITASNYGSKYILFLSYGIVRWWFFAVLTIIYFGNTFSNIDMLKTMQKIYFALLLFGVILVLHQRGIFHLSGIEGLGPRIVQPAERFSIPYDLRSMFWGSNRACVGSICFTGIWFAILLWFFSRGIKWRRNAIILALLMIVGLLGTWSRSDLVGLIVSLMPLIWISVKRPKLGINKLWIFTLLLIISFLMVKTIFDIKIQSHTASRFGSIMQYEWMGKGTGGSRDKMHVAIVKHLITNPEILLTGVGPNGFRCLYGEKGIWSNAAHNAFLHILTELGIFGLFLVFLWVFRIILLAKGLSKLKFGDSAHTRGEILFTILLCFLTGRIVTGYAVDTFFAVDAMIPSNVMLIAFVGLIISNSNERGKEFCYENSYRDIKKD